MLREFDEAFRCGCRSGLPPKIPQFWGTSSPEFRVQSPPILGDLGAEALKNEAKELIELTLMLPNFALSDFV